MNKRDWIQRLKRLRTAPEPLTSAAIYELIDLLNGRAPQRPRTEREDFNKRQMNWTGIGDVVFSFLENSERRNQWQQELDELLKSDTRHEYRQENVDDLEKRIRALDPYCARNRADAERKTVEWFKQRGIAMTKEKIHREFREILTRLHPESRPLPELQLPDWRKLRATQKYEPQKGSEGIERGPSALVLLRERMAAIDPHLAQPDDLPPEQLSRDECEWLVKQLGGSTRDRGRPKKINSAT